MRDLITRVAQLQQPGNQLFWAIGKLFKVSGSTPSSKRVRRA